MSNSPNFQSILDEAPTEVTSPPPLPVGTYLTTVINGEYIESSKKGTPGIEFTHRLIAAEADVDEDDLEASGGLEGRTIRNTYWLTPDAAFMLDQFHENCGLDLSEGESRRNRNDAVINAQVKVFIKHRPSNDGRVFLEVARTLPAD